MKKNIILYSTGCPQCGVLKAKLDAAKIDYRIVTDEVVMTNRGFQFLPVLEVAGKEYNFTQAVQWIKETCTSHGN